MIYNLTAPALHPAPPTVPALRRRSANGIPQNQFYKSQQLVRNSLSRMAAVKAGDRQQNGSPLYRREAANEAFNRPRKRCARRLATATPKTKHFPTLSVALIRLYMISKALERHPPTRETTTHTGPNARHDNDPAHVAAYSCNTHVHMSMSAFALPWPCLSAPQDRA